MSKLAKQTKIAKQTKTSDVFEICSKYSLWIFVIGLIVAASSAFIQVSYAGLILTAIGVAIGALNLNNKELLKPSIALLVLGLLDFSKVELIGIFAEPILNSLALVAAPVALLTALKSILASVKSS